MKIDIGSEGKILGTKKVSPNGQISGFTEHAGKDVLVVLPGDDVDVRLSAADLAQEVRAAANEHMKVAFHKYKDLKRRFDSPDNATRAFMARYAPATFQGLYDQVEHWASEQLDTVEKKVESRLDPKATTPTETP